ncbi:MAG: DUF732 domain-containing protein [Synechococcales bacterium]|nr:DUF732 domain-containing protein [Synechococcales bacterium]
MRPIIPLLGLVTAIPIASQPSALSAAPASLDNPSADSLCYIKLEDGRVINLNQLCGVDSKPMINLSDLDRRFLYDYQNKLRQRLGRSPLAENAILQAQQDPQAIVQRARAACSQIQQGMPPALTAIGSGGAENAFIGKLAIVHYCADLEN